MPPVLSSDAIACPDCGSQRLQWLGRIPDADVFAGVALPAPLSQGSLYRCRDCHLGLQWPVPPAAELEALYARAPTGVWTSAELRGDQRLALALGQAQAPGGDVLDVGCYDGRLLAAMAPGWRRFGIEASRDAARCAAERGVEVLGHSFDLLATVGPRFDLVLAIDVIEHVHSPARLLSMMAAATRPGGRIVVSTGDLDSPGWQQAGGRYWYSANAEHVAAISLPWAKHHCAVAGLVIEDVRRFSYRDRSYSEAELRRMQAQFRAAVRKSRWKTALLDLLAGGRARTVARTSFGFAGLFEDHLMLLLRKPA